MTHIDTVQSDIFSYEEEKFSWRRVGRIVKWPIVATLIILLVVYLPALWGWQFHYTWIGDSSWSMAQEGGITPLSIYYTKRYREYSVGDIISFEYKKGLTPQDNGPSIKMVSSVNPDGSYTVAGLNERCSVLPCDVRPEDIRGKVICKSAMSLIPTSYWRWLSLDWSLSVDEIGLREKRIYSLKTIKFFFSKEGRWRNHLAFNYYLTSVSELGNLVALQKKDSVELYEKNGKLIAQHDGYLQQLQEDHAVVATEDGVWKIGYKDPVRIFEDQCYTAMFMPNGKNYLVFDRDHRNTYRVGDKIKVNGQMRKISYVFFVIKNQKAFTKVCVSDEFVPEITGSTLVEIIN